MDHESRNPASARRFTRRRLLAGAGGTLAAGALLGPGGLASAASGRHPSVRRSAARAASGDLPDLSQWYHGYGEEGVQEAVEGYAAAFPDANVTVEWFPSDYDATVTAALLTDDGPDVFEFGNGPSLDMIQGGQVVPLDGILGDAESDFNERLIQRLTFDGHLWAVPQVIDMFFLIYRKSVLEAAGIQPPTTMDELIAAAAALTTGDQAGLFIGNDGLGPTGGVNLWSAGADYLTPDGQFGFATDAVYAMYAKMHELFDSGSLLQGAPADWSDPSAFITGLTPMQLTGLWTFPAILDSDVGDDFEAIAWPALDASTGGPSIPVGAWSSIVSSRSKDVDTAKAFVKWLWVDQTDLQTNFALDFGAHLPARNSLADAADKLQSGPYASALNLYQNYAYTQTPILWTPAMDTAYSDARSRMIAEGADPAEQIAAVQEVVEAELERIGAGSSSGSGAPAATSVTSATSAGGSEAPAGTEAAGTEPAGSAAPVTELAGSEAPATTSA